MFKNYFKTALRNLAKQKGLAFINIFGLSVGLACFSLFMLYAVNELSFDRFHKNANNIYRVFLQIQGINGGDAHYGTYHPMPLGPALKKDLPDVKNYVRMRGGGESPVRIKNDDIRRLNVSYADPDFFSVFTFNFIYGNPSAALQNQQNIVLTKSKAEELFGRTNVIGQTLEIKVDDQFLPFTITAVTEDIPANSSIRFDLLGSFHFLETTKFGQSSINNWQTSAYITYVQLQSASHLPDKAQNLLNFRKKYYPDEEADLKKAGLSWNQKLPLATYGLQPLLSMHTDTKVQNDVPGVDPKTIWILLSIAGGILLIACINFTTLAIGRSAGRAKEVGVRKVIGGTKRSLVLQFLTEALVLAVLSAALGFVLANILLPYFNQLSDRELNFSFLHYPELFWLMGGLVLAVALLAGSYPALVLSGFKPVEVLKAKVKLGGSNFFTKSLVTVQFVVSAALIICTLVIMQQLHYMQSKNPGFNKENVIVADASGTDAKKIYPLFKQELSKYPGIAGIASAEYSLGEHMGYAVSGFQYKGRHREVYQYSIDYDYLDVMGMQLLAGRNFDPAIASDTVNSVIVNEAMVKDFGWTIENTVGQKIKGYEIQAGEEIISPVVIGVVKDFNYLSFAEKIEPQMFNHFSSNAAYKFFIRTKPGDPSKTLSLMQSAWKKIIPDLPLKYSFLDEDLNRFYKSEARWSSIIGSAGSISIFLACLGLFGLAALAVVNRTKEIGIRKVLGATLSHIATLLSKDFLKLVVVAFFIASPIAWWAMNKWLQDYPYRINIKWWVFAITGISIIIIALVTVSFQAIKAAIANPVKSLRTE